MGAVVHDQLTFAPQATEGQFGNLVLHEDGSYTYTLHDQNAAVQALGAQDQLKDVFTCTVSDGKGGQTSTTLEVTVQGVEHVPSVPPAPAQETAPVSEPVVPVPEVTPAPSLPSDNTDMQEQMLQHSIQNGN